MQSMPDRCDAVDDTTRRRCQLTENHDGPHMDWVQVMNANVVEDVQLGRSPALDPGVPHWQLLRAEDYAVALTRKHPFLASPVPGAFLSEPVTQRHGFTYYDAFLKSGVYYSKASRPVTVDEFHHMLHAELTR